MGSGKPVKLERWNKVSIIHTDNRKRVMDSINCQMF